MAKRRFSEPNQLPEWTDKLLVPLVLVVLGGLVSVALITPVINPSDPPPPPTAAKPTTIGSSTSAPSSSSPDPATPSSTSSSTPAPSASPSGDYTNTTDTQDVDLADGGQRPVPLGALSLAKDVAVALVTGTDASAFPSSGDLEKPQGAKFTRLDGDPVVSPADGTGIFEFTFKTDDVPLRVEVEYASGTFQARTP